MTDHLLKLAGVVLFVMCVRFFGRMALRWAARIFRVAVVAAFLISTASAQTTEPPTYTNEARFDVIIFTLGFIAGLLVWAEARKNFKSLLP